MRGIEEERQRGKSNEGTPGGSLITGEETFTDSISSPLVISLLSASCDETIKRDLHFLFVSRAFLGMENCRERVKKCCRWKTFYCESFSNKKGIKRIFLP